MLAKIASSALIEQAEFGLTYREQQYEPLLTFDALIAKQNSSSSFVHNKGNKSLQWDNSFAWETKDEDAATGERVGLELSTIEEGLVNDSHWTPGLEDEAADAWGWIEKVDELSMCMREGLAFYGFQEARIQFPPSFKFHVGRTVEDYSEADDLRYGYQTWIDTHGGPTEARPPSW